MCIRPRNQSEKRAPTTDQHSKQKACCSAPLMPSKPKRIPCRCLFIGCFGVSVIVLGCTANYYQARSERVLARNEFRAVAERAVFSARESTLRAQQGNVAIATMYGNLFPEAESWPFVSIPNYNAIAEPISTTAGGGGGMTGIGLGIATFLSPDQVQEFSKFQQDYLESTFPNSPRRVYEFPASHRARPLPPSNYNVSAPVSQSYGSIAASTIMLDLFSTPLFRPTIENFILGQEESKKQCGVFSDFVMNVPGRDTEQLGPSFYYTHPIYPANEETTVVGMTISPISWNEVLQTAFRLDVSGIDCVLESSNGEQFSYTIQNGKPHFLGQGDLHRGGFDEFALAGDLNPAQDCGDDALRFQVTFYPSSEFQQKYSTSAPFMATLGVVCIMAFTSFLFFMYDCSVRKDMMEKQTVLEAKRNFMRFVSHEVRTPLNTVLMGLTVIREEIQSAFSMESEDVASEANLSVPYGAATDILALSDEIHTSADRAVDILNDLLNYDKIESGKLTLEKTQIDTWSFVENIFREFSLSAREVNLALNFSSLPNGGVVANCASDLPVSIRDHKVIGDSVRLAQVIRNLLSNALKFTPSGGNITLTAEYQTYDPAQNICSVKDPSCCDDTYELDASNNKQDVLCVEEAHHRRSGFLKLTVRDDGIGMTPDQRKKLFGQGVQFNANVLQNGKGSGLGLFIAKGIVEQHDGTLEAFSDGLGLGSEFVATIPLFRVDSDSLDHQHCANETLQEEVKVESIPEETPNMSVDYLRALVVDDAPMNRKLLTRLLDNRGWICDAAEDGQVALDMVKKAEAAGEPYDLILLDYEMPIMNGPAAAREIRSIGCQSCMLGITGNVLPNDVRFFKECGVAEVLGKPIRIDDLERLWKCVGVSPRDETALELFG